MISSFWANAALAHESVLTLSNFLAEVRSQSPDLSVEKANVSAAQARAIGIRINPPMIGLMRMRSQGNNTKGYEVSQELPFPTKMIQDKKLRDLEFDAQKESSEFQRANVLAEARLSFVSFWNSSEQVKILREKRDWLKHHVKLTRTTAWSDTAAKIHLLEIESEADMVDSEIFAAEAELSERRSFLKIYAPDLKTDSLTPAEPTLASIGIENVKSGPILAWRETEVRARDAMLNLTKQAYVPDLYVRLRSFEESGMSPQNDELMIGVTLPFLFFWQPKSEVAQASAQKLKAEAELNKARIVFTSQLASLSKKATAIEGQIKILNEKLIPGAERRVKLMSNLSQRTMESLDQHRSIKIASLDLKTKAANLRLEHETVVVEILKLIGDVPEVGIK